MFRNRDDNYSNTYKLKVMITGYSKLDKEKRTGVLGQYTSLTSSQIELLKSFNFLDPEIQKIVDGISENAVSNFILPFSVVPNFRINNKEYFVPMVTEESSVVAAIAFAAKFWAQNEGFKAVVTGMKKTGQIYFTCNINFKNLYSSFSFIKERLVLSVKSIAANMEKRGGGILDMELLSLEKPFHYELRVYFDTVDSMGANFINSCLEIMADNLKLVLESMFDELNDSCEIIMAILSNYTPDCAVECFVECDFDKLKPISGGLSPEKFSSKFETAVQIAKTDTYRAVTHNKGIFNGIDSVLTATGNDFRAVEACGHAFASKDGKYKALTDIEIKNNVFRYSLSIPLTVGTVGGLTTSHPVAKLALQILGNPSAKELMQIIASVGLASNFTAIRSLITEGIQKGHMKLHLNNILLSLDATLKEKNKALEYFKDKQISYKAVSDYIEALRTL